ncbi:MAG: transposase, partial [Chloroflexi bacterium]|nr:transposase [Chloroflexota bacterium]
KYRAAASACAACPEKDRCCPNATSGRTVHRSLHSELIESLEEHLQTPDGKRMLHARQTTSEGTFARLIGLLHWRRCRTWGRRGAQAEALEAESAQPEPEPIQLNPETTPSATLSEGALDSPASDSLQLSISATSGSLDLKAVDRSINEIPAVVDVTLLDYDGRNATLKIWTTETADPAGVKEALLESFRRNFGDGQDTEISIDLEGEQA